LRREVCAHLGVELNFKFRPYLSLAKLKGFRDTLAHGKPVEKEIDEEIVATAEELEAMGILHADWEKNLDQGFFNELSLTSNKCGRSCLRSRTWLCSTP
jgi:hypothetical protein